jgi:hypothetical protein
MSFPELQFHTFWHSLRPLIRGGIPKCAPVPPLPLPLANRLKSWR